MNRIMKYTACAGVMLLILCFSSCADQTLVNGNPEGEGTLLNMYVNIEQANTRLAELPMGQISIENDGKKDIGLYIYYEDNYKAGDLSKPYIRNMRCTAKGSKLTTTEPIYIYDRMTIVAFYPYNAAMSEVDNYFTKPIDEKAYPITESDYSKQTYIPYRAETNVNPTNAYDRTLGFGPQQTSKVEVVLVALDKSSFPTDVAAGDIKLIPSVDKYDGTYQGGEDLRESWVDVTANFPESGTPDGGNYVRRYTAYVWKSADVNTPHHDTYTHENNILKKGEILFESKELTLVVPAQVNLSEQIVYRYGYNMDTGEIFIPTSDKLIYDATSLQGAKFNDHRAYQVGDIDLAGKTWTPLTTTNGTYDGGGHAIKNLNIDATPTEDIRGSDYKKQMFGLFSDVTGNSTLMNINLVNPTITVDYTNEALTDTCYVGAICGLVNPELSEKAMRDKIYNSLPNELSEAVKQALIDEQMKNLGSTTSKIRGSKVSNPTITVTGNYVHIGGLTGGAGNLKQKAEIKDSYVTGGDIAVNATDEDTKKKYESAYVGGFCGMLSNGMITNCYSKVNTIYGYIKDASAPENIVPKDESTGFCTFIDAKKLPTGASTTTNGCFTNKKDNHATLFTTGWPTNWPLFKDDTEATNHGLSGEYNGNPYPCYRWEDSWKDMGMQDATYPTLIWETPFTVENK